MFFCLIVLGLSGFAELALADAQPVGATPANNPGDWITAGDYPPAALRGNMEGTTGFKVTVNASGAVTGCEIMQGSGSAELDTQTCTLVTQRARFNPAIGRDGRPTDGSFRSRVIWAMPNKHLGASSNGPRFANDPREWVTADDYPKAALRANVQGTATYRVAIDMVGNVVSCNIGQSTGSKLLDDATCSSVIKRARFTPATDQDGHPAAGSYVGRFAWLIPDTVYRPPTAGKAVERMIIELDGRPSHCQAAGAEVGGTQLAYEPCSTVTYRPYRNAAGQPVRKLVTVTSVTTITDVPN